MVFSTNKLRGRIAEMYGNQQRFASKIGWTQAKLSRRLSGVSEFSREDILLLARHLAISPTEIASYFFTLEVEDSQLERRG